MSTTTFADVAEGVRATIAAYTHALDDGRTDDVVATFCPDGVVRHPGHGHPRGPRRAARGLRASGRRGGRSATSSSTRSSPTGTTDEAERDQRRGLPPAGRRRLGGPARRPLPRHPPPRRRHLALPPPRSRVPDLGGTSGEHAAVSSRPVDDGQRRQELGAGDRGEPDARARRVLRVVAGEGRPRRR